MICEFCKNKFSSTSNLLSHQRTAKYCLDKQNKEIDNKFTCDGCKCGFTRKQDYNRHINICKSILPFEIVTENNQLKEKMNDLKQTIEEQKQTIKELQDKLENVAIHAVSRPTYFQDEAVIEIEVDSGDENEEDNEEYQLKPLDVGAGYQIENRESDGYINVTNLCKAGGKKFNDWKRLNKTDDFLRELSGSIGNPIDQIIQTGTGSKFTVTGIPAAVQNSNTWVHPQVAINIAQWISPKFDVKVSAWVYEIMMTGKVDITNTKSYRELQSENKNHKLQIKKLTNKYVKSQPRVQYKEQNVIYILTTPSLKKERRYILGKATNLTNRLSTYNKTDEHEVMYYQECLDCESMSVVETMVFQKLKDYREQANREIFILPKEKTIDFFRDVIKNAIEYVVGEK
jgi:cell division protein FtsB